jgi:hypothetical protein
MVRRLVSGLLLGALIGAAMAAAMVSGLKMAAFTGTLGVLLAYGAAALTGVLTGLITGKPFWAPDAKTEAGIKAFFGALLAAGGMFALRQWAAGWTIDLAALGAGGPAPIGELPAASLPLLAAVLGGFFGLDNSGEAPGPKKRLSGVGGAGAAGEKTPARAPREAAEDEDTDAVAPSRRARR